MAPPDHGSGGPPAAAPALMTQTSCTCTCSCRGGKEPAQHERKLSSATSSSSPAASPSPSTASTTYLPASSHKSSCESLPFAEPELGNQSSFSSTSSYESFFHIDPDHDCSKFLDFEPAATRPPAVQTMMAQGGAAAHDPKRLPSSMFRTRCTSPAEWSVTSNESLFSIQLSHSDDLGALYADLYHDAAGLPRFPSVGREAAALKLPSLSEGSGALCVRHDCARCSGSGTVRKSVRFAAAETVVFGDGKQSTVTTLAVATDEVEAPAAAAKTQEAPAGWCEFWCCWPAPPTVWWPRCCECHDCGCQCK